MAIPSSCRRRDLWLLVTLVAWWAGCSSSPASTDSGEATTTTDIQAVVTLEHKGTSPLGVLTIYSNRLWTFVSYDMCKSVEGDIAESELEAVRRYLADESLRQRTVDVMCPDSGFQLFVNYKFVCWDEELLRSASGSAFDNLTRLFHDKASQLPWDGVKRNCSLGAPPGVGPKTARTDSPPPPPQAGAKSANQ